VKEGSQTWNVWKASQPTRRAEGAATRLANIWRIFNAQRVGRFGPRRFTSGYHLLRRFAAKTLRRFAAKIGHHHRQIPKDQSPP